MSVHNPELETTLDEAVKEVLGILTGLDLDYDPRLDRYQAVTRQLNRALRANALEKEWSYYASVETIGTATPGDAQLWIPHTVRPRIINDDAVRLVNDKGVVRAWAYFLPRDALHKYQGRRGLWASVTRNVLSFSRPFHHSEDGLEVQLPVMREPMLFRLPQMPEDPEEEIPEVPMEIRQQPLDFSNPDLITLRAAFYYAQSDPIMQPRVQMLENQYKDLMYQMIERDDRNTDSPYLNDFEVPVQAGIHSTPSFGHNHPHADGVW